VICVAYQQAIINPGDELDEVGVEDLAVRAVYATVVSNDSSTYFSFTIYK
jgi:hypothetical protein